jgi:hypothetical protein
MVDREPSNTYLVNRDHSEIWFDLGANRSLLLKTLTFRQRADYGSSMTQTAIQGSVDGITFEEFAVFQPVADSERMDEGRYYPVHEVLPLFPAHHPDRQKRSTRSASWSFTAR